MTMNIQVMMQVIHHTDTDNANVKHHKNDASDLNIAYHCVIPAIFQGLYPLEALPL